MKLYQLEDGAEALVLAAVVFLLLLPFLVVYWVWKALTD